MLDKAYQLLSDLASRLQWAEAGRVKGSCDSFDCYHNHQHLHCGIQLNETKTRIVRCLSQANHSGGKSNH